MMRSCGAFGAAAALMLQSNHDTSPNTAPAWGRVGLRVLRWSVSALCVVFIAWRLQSADFSLILASLTTADLQRLVCIGGAILLVPVNLGLEAARWRLCLGSLEVRSWRSHFAAVVTGISIGLPFTHLVGDYSGKLALARRHAGDAVPLLMASSFSQYWVSYLGGMAGLLFLQKAQLLPDRLAALGDGLAIWGLFLLGAYYLLPRIYRWARRLPFAWAGRLPESVQWPSLTNLLGLSLLRYGVILAQYALLVSFFSPQASLLLFLAGTSIALCIKTLVPFLSVGGMIGVRELLALTLLGSLGFDDPTVLAVSLSIWVFNIALPALVGSTVLARIRSGAWWQL